MIILTQLLVNFLVLRALPRDDSSLNQLTSSCMFDIIQFQPYARDK